MYPCLLACRGRPVVKWLQHSLVITADRGPRFKSRFGTLCIRYLFLDPAVDVFLPEGGLFSLFKRLYVHFFFNLFAIVYIFHASYTPNVDEQWILTVPAASQLQLIVKIAEQRNARQSLVDNQPDAKDGWEMAGSAHRKVNGQGPRSCCANPRSGF